MSATGSTVTDGSGWIRQRKRLRDVFITSLDGAEHFSRGRQAENRKKRLHEQGNYTDTVKSFFGQEPQAVDARESPRPRDFELETSTTRKAGD